MKIINYFESKNQNVLNDKIARCDWRAAHYLANILKNGSFHATLGGAGDLFLLMDGDNLVSFATLTHQDSILDENLFPWIGFVFTAQEYRSQGCAGRILAHAEAAAAEKGYSRVYLSTDAVGLYEKYGYQYLENRVDRWDSDQRVLYKDLKKESA